MATQLPGVGNAAGLRAATHLGIANIRVVAILHPNAALEALDFAAQARIIARVKGVELESPEMGLGRRRLVDVELAGLCSGKGSRQPRVARVQLPENRNPVGHPGSQFTPTVGARNIERDVARAGVNHAQVERLATQKEIVVFERDFGWPLLTHRTPLILTQNDAYSSTPLTP